MITKKNLNFSKMPLIIAIFSLAYISWQLIGIRFQNHDDIYFHLYSYIFSDNYIEFAKNTAFKQARVQAFFNMPIILWTNGFQGSIFFDLIIILNYALLFASLIYFLSALIDRQSAILLISFTVIVFPLHYYFTFPQGYPVMGSYGLILALLSAGMLASFLKKPRSLKLAGSVLLFIVSLWGPEYNFILHPIFLFFIILFAEKNKTLNDFGSVYFSYALGWLVSLGIYLSFSMLSREVGGDAYGRVTLAFDLSGWIKTFFILQEKAFLPVGLIKGIVVVAEGVQDTPVIFDYLAIWGVFGGWSTAVIIFFIFLILFFLILYNQKLSRRSLLITSALMLTIAVVPILIVSGSVHYQNIVLNGFLQGHLVTFYSHLGLSGLAFIVYSFIVNEIKTKVKIFYVFVFSAMLAFYGVITFAYNNVNRQIMMVNAQKWNAMELLVSYIRAERPDLLDSQFYAPKFWSTNGVSSIPSESLIGNENYWTSYSEVVLGRKINFSNTLKNIDDNGVKVDFYPSPNASSIVVLGEFKKNIITNFFVLSTRPEVGFLFDTRSGVKVKDIAYDDWVCSKYCTVQIQSEIAISDFSVVFQSSNVDNGSTLSKFFIKRSSGYGSFPLNSSDLNSFKIENWGPQNTEVGLIPNPQPDGTSGIWIKLKSGSFQSNLQVMIDGNPALKTNIQKELITASVDAIMFSVAGKKMLTINNLTNGSSLFIGEIEVK